MGRRPATRPPWADAPVVLGEAPAPTVPGTAAQRAQVREWALDAADDIEAISLSAPPAGCGAADPSECRRRAALLWIFFGSDWRDEAAGVAIYRRGSAELGLWLRALQDAWGLRADGVWGRSTNAEMARRLAVDVSGFGGGEAAPRRPEPPPAPSPSPGPQPPAQGGGGTLVAWALVGIGAAMALAGR